VWYFLLVWIYCSVCYMEYQMELTISLSVLSPLFHLIFVSQLCLYVALLSVFLFLSLHLSHAYICTFCLYEKLLCSEGTALLFISAGIGQHAIERAAKLAGVWSIITTAVFAYIFKSLFVEDANGAYLARADLVHSLWEALLLLFYLTILLLSLFKYQVYRPAALVWARYWACARVIISIAVFLERMEIDFGFCAYTMGSLTFDWVFKCWIALRCFRLGKSI
jgi:hypothetical protein